jgi:hypothetical protein
MARRRHTGLGEVAAEGLVGPLGLAEGELYGRVPIALRGLRLRDAAGARLHQCHRHGASRVVEDLGHPELVPEDALYLGHLSPKA